MRQHKLFWGSSYDRGCQHLLKMWPDIKKVYHDATLDFYYGWDLFDIAYANNPERQEWKKKMQKLMEAPGITEHGRVNKEDLAKGRQECGIWAYPTDFGETNCITALDCQLDGVVPCVMNRAGLRESVQSGIRVEGDIEDELTKATFLEQLIKLMGDKEMWEEQQRIGHRHALKYKWPRIAKQWSQHLGGETNANAHTSRKTKKQTKETNADKEPKA